MCPSGEFFTKPIGPTIAEMLMSGDWREQLRQARRSLGLSQAEASRRAHVSESALKSWESHNVRVQRKPAREAIKSVLDALQVDRDLYNHMMDELGYATSLDDYGPRFEFHLHEAAELVNERPWPASVVNDHFEVLHGNRAFRTVLSLPPSQEGDDELDRNLLCIFSRPNFYGRLEDWQALASTYLGAVAGRAIYDRRPPNGDSATYFNRIAEWLDVHAPERSAAFRVILGAIDRRPAKLRWHMPLEWEHQSLLLRFDVMLSPASSVQGLAFQDFIPLDAQTWNALDQMLRAADQDIIQATQERSG